MYVLYLSRCTFIHFVSKNKEYAIVCKLFIFITRFWGCNTLTDKIDNWLLAQVHRDIRCACVRSQWIFNRYTIPCLEEPSTSPVPNKWTNNPGLTNIKVIYRSIFDKFPIKRFTGNAFRLLKALPWCCLDVQFQISC